MRLDRLAQDPAQAAAQASLRQALEQIGLQVSASPRPSTGSGPGCKSALPRRALRSAHPGGGAAPLLEQMLAPLDVAFTLHWRGQPRRLPLDGTGMEQLLVNLIKNGAEVRRRV